MSLRLLCDLHWKFGYYYEYKKSDECQEFRISALRATDGPEHCHRSAKVSTNADGLSICVRATEDRLCAKLSNLVTQNIPTLTLNDAAECFTDTPEKNKVIRDAPRLPSTV